MQSSQIDLSTDELIAALGGTAEVARLLHLTQQAVSNWTKRGGIPSYQYVPLLALTAQHGIHWRPPGWPPALQLRWHPAPVELAVAA